MFVSFTLCPAGAASWRSLLLPSSPAAQKSLLPLPSLSPGPLVNNLMNFDIPQDFYLPDDQFASLKLHKLRQVAVESGVEHFTSPSYNTRRSNRRPDSRHSGVSSDPVMRLPLPLSLTPTIANSPHLTEAKQTARQSIDLQNLSTEHKLTDKLTSQSLTEESPDREMTENPGEQQTENLHPECQTHTTECVSVDPDCAADKVNGYVTGHSDELRIKESSVVSSEEQTHCPVVVHPLEDQSSTNHQTEDKAVIKTLSFDCPLQKTPEEPSNNCPAVQACRDSEFSVQHLNVTPPESSANSTLPPTENKSQDRCLPHLRVHSQLLLRSPLASAPFITTYLRSPGVPSSPALPSLGLTPHPVPAALPLTSSPSAPALTLPPPHSPSVRALSPPALSPCRSLTSLPASLPPTSPASHIQASPEPFQKVEPATCPAVSSISGGRVGLRTEEAAEEHVMRCTHTLKVKGFSCRIINS